MCMSGKGNQGTGKYS
uniref:Uncharacterized protein n=1 Tax=Rhizophora mucronata TaxID=61149 RepID=A0A2P2PNI1_RHIMU